MTRGEIVEAELDRLITKRHGKRVADEGERPALEAWQESERRYDEQRRLQARAEWHLYHTAQAARHRRTLEALASYHEEAAAKLQGGPKGEA